MHGLPERVLLATDGSENAALAATIAADLSARAGAELRVIHVLEPLPRFAYPGVTPEIYSLAFGERRLEAQDLLDAQVERVRDRGTKVHGVYLEVGSPVDEILDLAEETDADLTIVGNRGLGPMKRLALGSVSEGIIHHAARPVLVARGGESSWPPARIVVADDGSADARKAGELAAGIGRLYGAEGILVRAYAPFRPKVSRESRRYQLDAFYDAMVEDEKDLKKRAGELEGVLGSCPRVVTREGDTATVVVREAERGGEVSLLAVGSRGMGPISRMRLGSVSTKIVRAVRSPVLICPHSQSLRSRRPVRRGHA